MKHLYLTAALACILIVLNVPLAGAQSTYTPSVGNKQKIITVPPLRGKDYKTRVERDRRHKVIKGTSYRNVGTYNPELSQLCARGLFGQKRVQRTGIYFEKDNKIVGGAHGSGWNLYDPTRKADPLQHYWFYRQGFTNCEVFVVLLRGQ